MNDSRFARSVAFTDVAIRSLRVGAARDFQEGVFFIDAAILGFPTFWHVSAVEKPYFDGEIQSGAIGAGLTSRNDLTKHRHNKSTVRPGFKHLIP
jgi:hypothetical protein